MLQGSVFFETEIAHCPNNPREENQCVGIFNVHAYLQVSGNVIKNASSWTPGGAVTPNPHWFSPATYLLHPWNVQWESRVDKILPVRFEIRFRIDFADSPGAHDTLFKCWEIVDTNRGLQPKSYYDDLFGGIVPLKLDFTVSTAYAQVREEHDCLVGTITVLWQGARLGVHGGAGGGASMPGGLIPFMPPPAVGGGLSGGIGLGGATFPLQVGFEICYRDGCMKISSPSDTATDAIAVYNAGGIFTP